jgi:hypothetical protein
LDRLRPIRAALLAAVLFCAFASAALGQQPNPGAVAFQSSRCDQGGVPEDSAPPGASWCRFSIFTVAADGSSLTRLTTGASGEEGAQTGGFTGDLFPSFSPTGERIVFVRNIAGSPPQLFTMRSDGGDQRRLLPESEPGPGNPVTPVWSPTGDAIAFTGAAGDPQAGLALDTAVFVFEPLTGALRRLSPQGVDATGPTFTPDGHAVVYFGSVPPTGAEYGLIRTTVDGARTDRVTLGDLQLARNGMSFSPDGRYAAVSGSDARLYTISADGREIVPRTAGRAVNPTWSPIGPTLFYVAAGAASQTMAIHRVALTGGAQPVRLTDGLARDDHPSFSLAAGLLPQLPIDQIAPGVVVGLDPGLPAGLRARKAGALGAAAGSSRIPFLAFDPSGLRRVEASLARRVGRRGCRLADARGKLGRASHRCSSARYFRIASVASWRARTSRLPGGTYELRFRTRDANGNATRKPRRRVVKLARRG